VGASPHVTPQLSKHRISSAQHEAAQHATAQHPQLHSTLRGAHPPDEGGTSPLAHRANIEATQKRAPSVIREPLAYAFQHPGTAFVPQTKTPPHVAAGRQLAACLARVLGPLPAVNPQAPFPCPPFAWATRRCCSPQRPSFRMCLAGPTPSAACQHVHNFVSLSVRFYPDSSPHTLFQKKERHSVSQPLHLLSIFSCQPLAPSCLIN